MGNITETATAAPGYTSVLPNTKAPLPLTLKLNGYSTAQFGKCHEVPVWQTSPAGPFTAWPTGGGGFELLLRFHLRREQPMGSRPVRGHHADRAAEDACRGLPPDGGPDRQGDQLGAPAEGAAARQAFLHVLRARCHPRPAPRAPGVDREVQGQVAHGWDKQREITFERQKELGVIPPDAVLTPRDAEIPAWDDMDPALKPVLEREMEVYAAFLEHTDHHVGRLLEALEPVLDDTLVYVIVGDNGASAEGTLQGAFNEMANFNGMADIETPEFLMSKIDEFGGEGSYGHYAVGWAWAMDSPYQWTKQVASHWGGTRNGNDRALAEGDQGKGRPPQPIHARHRSRAHSAGGGGHPSAHDGQRSPAEPVRGYEQCSTASTTQGRPSGHQTQYFEMFCNRGIYHKGWSAVTKHRTPWAMGGAVMPAFDDDVLGALRRQQRLDPIQRPVQGQSGETA